MPVFDFISETTKFEPKNALRFGEIARLAYDSEDFIEKHARERWGFQIFSFFDRNETEAFLVANEQVIIVSFRGTEPNKTQDCITDLNTKLVSGPLGSVHAGFIAALNSIWSDLWRKIAEVRNHSQSLWFTGHSLGAALATLATAKCLEIDCPLNGTYTFGQPRVGDRVFSDRFNALFKNRFFRFVNNNDIVTRIPPRAMGYSHVGSFRYFDDRGKYHEDIHFWNKFLASVKGEVTTALERWATLQTVLPDGLKDHNMDNYLFNLRKNFDPTFQYKQWFQRLFSFFKK